MEKVEIIELVKYRNFLHQQLNQEIVSLEFAEKDLLHTPNREIRLQRMKDLRNQIREIEPIFKENGSFKTDEFTDFMAKFLSLTEQSSVKSKWKGTDKKATYYVVSTPEELEILKESVKTRADFDKFSRLKGVTRIKGEVVYPFKSNLKMKDKYRDHYRLKIAIYELMQLKLEHPEMTDEERYSIVLENTVRRNLEQSSKISK